LKLVLNTPLTVTGGAMGLLLDLNIPKSTTYTPFLAGTPTLAPGGGQTAFNPAFSLTGVPLAANPATLHDGEAEDIHGQVTANSAGVFAIAAANGANLSFTTSSSTIFAGAGNTTPSPVGSFVDIDAALQADGSMLATRVQTEAISQLYSLVGQTTQFSALILQNAGREQQGPNLPNVTGFYGDNVQLGPSTLFEIAWPNGNVPAGLPFTPALNATSLVPGQNLATPVNSQQYINDVIPVTNTVTLEPQTINATVASVSTVNGQATYQVTLFADDLISIFGPGSSVVVYATAATHTITSSALTSGSVGRFRGLLFDDNGTLRMVATEIEDGVPGT
jgi:Domain of unknown function (DUF5666)